MEQQTAEKIMHDLVSLSDDSWVFVLPYAVRVFVELDIADVLGPGPMPVERIAELVDADCESLFRLMRALATTGVVARSGRDFQLTPLGMRFRSDSPNSARESMANLDSHLAWISAADTIRHGHPSFDDALGGRFFEHKDNDRAANLAFVRRMRARGTNSYARFPEAVDWTCSSTVLDIGGGDGYLIDRVLSHAPHLTGILFDRPATVELTAERPTTHAGRLSLVSGDFFQKLPAGADTHMLCSVLHDWSDDECRTILTNSRAALDRGGRLLVLEMVVPDDNRWHPSMWSDLGMMVLTGGRERGIEDFRSLLADAGYELAAVHEIPDSDFHVLEAR
jgi:hypothetical protein